LGDSWSTCICAPDNVQGLSSPGKPLQKTRTEAGNIVQASQIFGWLSPSQARFFNCLSSNGSPNTKTPAVLVSRVIQKWEGDNHSLHLNFSTIILSISSSFNVLSGSPPPVRAPSAYGTGQRGRSSSIARTNARYRCQGPGHSL